MPYSFTRNSTVLNIELFGQIDLSITNQIKIEFDGIISKDFTSVLLSAKNLEYIDSSGVASLLMIKRRCDQIDCQFTICEISEVGYRVIELAKLNTLLPIKKVISREKTIKKEEFKFSEDFFNGEGILNTQKKNDQDPSEIDFDDSDFKPGSFL